MWAITNTAQHMSILSFGPYQKKFYTHLITMKTFEKVQNCFSSIFKNLIMLYWRVSRKNSAKNGAIFRWQPSNTFRNALKMIRNEISCAMNSLRYKEVEKKISVLCSTGVWVCETIQSRVRIQDLYIWWFERVWKTSNNAFKTCPNELEPWILLIECVFQSHDHSNRNFLIFRFKKKFLVKNHYFEHSTGLRPSRAHKYVLYSSGRQNHMRQVELKSFQIAKSNSSQFLTSQTYFYNFKSWFDTKIAKRCLNVVKRENHVFTMFVGPAWVENNTSTHACRLKSCLRTQEMISWKFQTKFTFLFYFATGNIGPCAGFCIFASKCDVRGTC